MLILNNNQPFLSFLFRMLYRHIHILRIVIIYKTKSVKSLYGAFKRTVSVQTVSYSVSRRCGRTDLAEYKCRAHRRRGGKENAPGSSG